MSWFRRLRNTIAAKNVSDVFDEETRFHLERRIEDNIRFGMSESDAVREAKKRLGNLTLARELAADADTLRWLGDFFRDIRYAFRSLRRKPGFAAIVMLTLGLGVGLNTTMFAFADTLIFRPLDVRKPEELVRIFSTTKDIPLGTVSYPDYMEFRDKLTTVKDVAAYQSMALPLSRRRDNPRDMGSAVRVSGNYFSLIGVPPMLGRGLRAEDDRQGAAPVVVIGYDLWTRFFDSRTDAVGQELYIVGQPFTVVGVMRRDGVSLDALAAPADVYVPLASLQGLIPPAATPASNDRSAGWLTVVGRLQPGATAEGASSEITTLAGALDRAQPDTAAHHSAVALPDLAARRAQNPARQQVAALLLGLAGLVLLASSANVANLLLSHASARTEDIAVRLALGASRIRLLRLLFAESFVLAVGGGLCGLALAYVGTRYLTVLVESILSAYDLRPVFAAHFDRRVMLFLVLASFATIVVFGLIPALRMTSINMVTSLRGIRTTGGSRWRLTTRGALISAQVAVSVIVLGVAALSLQQFVDVRRADPGFQTDHVLLLTFDPTAVGHTPQQASQFYKLLLEQTRTLPGVRAAGLTQDVPLILGARTASISVDGASSSDITPRPIRSFVVDPGYWPAMRTPLIRGRAFADSDTATTPPVVVINETMSRLYWPNRDPIGRTVRVGGADGRVAQVIGIAKDGKYGSISEQPQPAIFLPFSQQPNAAIAMTLLVRTVGDPVQLAGPIRAAARSVEPNMPAFNVRALGDVYQAVALGQQALVTQIVVAIGLLGTILTVIGLYGVISYLTSLRRREIGVRLVLGATGRNISILVMKQAAQLGGVGMLIGLVLMYLLTPAFAVAFSFDAHAIALLAAVTLGLALTAGAASLIPARRAAHVDPVVTLRAEQ